LHHKEQIDNVKDPCRKKGFCQPDQKKNKEKGIAEAEKTTRVAV